LVRPPLSAILIEDKVAAIPLAWLGLGDKGDPGGLPLGRAESSA